MPVIARFRKTIEHLKTDYIQVAKLVVISFNTTCNCMFCSIKNQSAIEGVMFNMLNFENDAVLTLIKRHYIRGNTLAKCFRERRIHKSDFLDAVSAVKLKRSIEKIHGNRFIFRCSEKQFENIVVIDIYIFVESVVFRDTSRDITPALVCFADIFKHFRILRFVHKKVLYTIRCAKKRMKRLYCVKEHSSHKPRHTAVKIWEIYLSRLLPQSGYVSQRIPHGFSTAGVVKPPLPSISDLQLREGMNPPVDAYASVSGMIWSVK